MDLTLFVNPEHRPTDDLGERLSEHVAHVALARELGYDGVAIGTHLSYGSAAWFPPFQTLMHLLPAADGMQLATCMLVLPFHHPLHVATEAAFLDVASNGRFTLGVSAGWSSAEFDQLGLERRTRIGRFRESVELIRRLWADEPVDVAGRYFNVGEIALAMRPTQRPRPPMWFGGSVNRSVERAAELADTALGDTWVASSHLTDDVIVEQARCFQRRLDELGKPRPSDFPVLRNIVVAPDRATAWRDAAPFLSASYGVFEEWGLFSDVVGTDADSSELLAGRVIIGSPEECADQLVRLVRATQLTRLIARVQWMGMDRGIVQRTICLLAERVRPLVERELRS